MKLVVGFDGVVIVVVDDVDSVVMFVDLIVDGLDRVMIVF